MAENPWLKFYPSDWRAGSVGRCTPAARGLAIELLGFIHEADDRGRLLINGKKPDLAAIAEAVRIPARQTRKLLAELIEAGAFKRWRGYIVSPRAERDAKRLAKQSEDGRKGAAKRYGSGPNSPDGSGASANTPKGGAKGRPSPQRPEARGQKKQQQGNAQGAPVLVLISDDWRPSPDAEAKAAAMTGLTETELEGITSEFLSYWLTQDAARDWDATWLLRVQQLAPKIRAARIPEASHRHRKRKAGSGREAIEAWLASDA